MEKRIWLVKCHTVRPNFIMDTLDAKNSNGYDATHIWKRYEQATQKLWYDGTGKFVPFENF